MEGTAKNTEVVQYYAQRNEVFGANNFDGTSKEGQYKRLLVN
jgi:hypothetical protein